MAHDSPPNLVVMRLSPPTYECAAWQLMDASDALVALETETVENVKHSAYMPMLLLPQYVNECFLGETLSLSILLTNGNKTPCTNVKLTVEVTTDEQQKDPFVIEPFSDITLEGNTKPYQTSISYLFHKSQQHFMTFIVTYNCGKKSYQVIKRAVWNVVNPLKAEFLHKKDSIGRSHLEATLTNSSQLNVTIKDVKLVMPESSAYVDPITPPNDDLNAVCVLRPNHAHSVIFTNVRIHKALNIKVFWFCYERGTGQIDMPVDLFSNRLPIVYETIRHPGTVSLKEEFKITFKVTNTTSGPLDCMLRFHEEQLKPLAVQVESYMDSGGLAPAESKIIDVPFISLAKGFHTIGGIEIHVKPNIVIPITDLQVLTL
ncbi:uncharacterized protein BXIN_2520 [Babesia sp. Xinjiang]|uniref:uncharacterized protein n=1 Tax=Babesia sp. Xinjiang TaxID=462227 RepID=UPI000A24F336|nr:uncharacterized protein BXIN_2520 [Babesia sp. Xinjiang]ORM41469.1 hypothetical protein BXIN_2520 [Babesia sp. Xinjiang]